MKSGGSAILTTLIIFGTFLMLGETNFLNRAFEWVDHKVFNCRLRDCCNEFNFNPTGEGIFRNFLSVIFSGLLQQLSKIYNKK